MNVLLTGGAGYVGSACLRWLARRGHQVIAFDDLSEGNPSALAGAKLVRGDVTDYELLTRTLRGLRIDAVMHFAALTSVPESMKRPNAYWTTNVLGTKCVLDAMVAAGVRRLVFSSTAAVYGAPERSPLTEEAPLRPLSPYGSTKLSAERLIRDVARSAGIGAAILRYFNASGADPQGAHGEDRHAEGHLIPLVLQTAVGRRHEIQVYGDDYPTRDGTCVRDYVHVDDLARAHQLALDALEPGAELTYNLGSGQGSTVLEVVSACERAVGRPVPHTRAPRRPGDPPELIASPARIERDLGWTPRHDLRAIVEHAWAWHASHPQGYATLRRQRRAG